VKEDFQLDSYTVPKDASFGLFNCALHRNQKIFPEPEVYRLKRFLSDSITKSSPYAYVPFSAGPRNCIGQRFALTEEKIVLANVFRNLTVTSIDHRDKIRPSMELVLRPRDPIRIRLKIR